MDELYCGKSSQYLFTYAERKGIRSTFVANCIFNSFFTYASIMLNIVTIYAIRKTSAMAKTLKTLLLSLACSDVAVGLFSQPIYTFFLVKGLKLDNLNCNTYLVLNISGYLFSTASLLGVVAVSVDRFLAVHLHLRYQELVTHKRVVVVMISKWVCSAIYFFVDTVGASEYSRSSIYNYCSFGFHYHIRGLYQDIFYCPTAQESDSLYASTTSSAF